jgi:riboflavin kinase/FMN adenylyltransferase
MQIFRKLNEIPVDFGPTLVSVGNFDGVHRAHVRVLKEIVSRSATSHTRSVAVTFEPHPMRILRPESAPKLLTPTTEKLRLLASTGIDAAVVIPFTRDLSLMNPREFVSQILSERLHAQEVHEGYNFRFGHKASGDVPQLCDLGREFDFKVVVYPEMRLRGQSVSSTRIRELVAAGDVRRARWLLGRPFSIQSSVGRGRGYGSKYTVPTINLGHYDELIPRHGVYISRTAIAGECFDSVTNVGDRPTFGTGPFAVESHLLDFHPVEVTGDTKVELTFLARIRNEVKFSSVEELRAQIQRDIAQARAYFARLHRSTASARISR